MKAMMKHLKEHQTYPASKDQLVEACNNLEDVSLDEKKYFEENLPEGSYGSAEDVMKALSSMTSEIHAY